MTKEKGYDYDNIDHKQLKKTHEIASTGGSFYLKASKLIEGDSDFRLLPPSPKMEGIFYLELLGYWIAGKFYVSPKTFGSACPIEEIVKEAEAKDDEDINALLNSANYREVRNYLIPGLLLDIKFKKSEVKSFKVRDDQIKILQCGPQLWKAINRLVVHRNYNKLKGGIFHCVDGYNITITKKGAGKETEYSATGWTETMEIQEKWLKDLPDLKKITKKRLLTDKELSKAIKGFLYGKGSSKKKGKKKKGKKDEDGLPF